MSESTNRKLILPVGDSRLNEFIRRAGPVITSERGLNDRSRVKLRAIANDLKLPKGLYELALEYFQQSGIEASDNLTRNERNFCNSLEKKFRNQDRQILSTDLEQSCLELGTDKHQLSIDRSRQLIHDVARTVGLQRVSIKEAESYLNNLVDEQIGSATILNDQLRDRLHRAALSWGVDLETVDGFIDHRIDENTRSQSSSGTSKRTVALGLCVVAVSLFLYFFSMYQRNQIDARLDNATEIETADEPETVDEPATVAINSLWSEETASRMLKAKAENPVVENYWNVWASEKHEPRISLVNNLLDNVFEFSDSDRFDQLVDLQVLLLDVDTNPEAAQQIETNLANRISVSYSKIPENIDAIKTSFDANRMTFAVWQGLSEDSKSKASLGQSMFVQVGFDPATCSEDSREANYLTLSEQSLSRQWIDAFVSLADEDTKNASKLITPIREFLATRLDAEFIDSRTNEAVLSILQLDPEQFGELQELAKQLLNDEHPDRDRDRLRRWSELLWSTQNKDLRRWLSLTLAEKLELDPNIESTELIIAIRKRLNGNADQPLFSRKQAFITWLETDEDLRAIVQGNEVPELDIDAVAEVARWATQALALSENQIDRFQSLAKSPTTSLFDEVLKNGSSDSIRFWNSENVPRSTHVESMAASIETLDDKQASESAKLNAFKRIVSISSRFKDVHRKEAVAITNYLLGATTDDTIVFIRQELPNLQHWSTLHLALIDSVDSSECSIDHFLTIANLLTGSRIEIASRDRWRDEVRNHLFNTFIETLNYSIAAEHQDDSLLWDQLDEHLKQETHSRLSLLNAEVTTPESYLDLNGMLAEKLFANNRLEKQLALVEFTAENEIHKSILAGRVLLDHVALGIKQHNPQIDSKIVAVQNWHTRQANALENYDEQILLNEITLLKLWAIACQTN